MRDFYRFYHVETANAVVRLCEACKRVCGGRQIVGAFYGYTASYIDIGHHAADVVLASPAVDFLASPFCYNDARPLGGDLSLPGAVDSTLLHGKIWFVEADIRTCRSQQIYDCTPFVNPNAKLKLHNRVWEGPKTIEGSLAKMTQAFGRVLTGGLAMWWFDMWGGWYRDQAFMDFIVKAKAIYDRAALSGQSRQTAQFAVFADGDSGPFLTEFLLKMSRMGLPWHVFVSEDIPLVNPDDYRVGCFLSEKSWNAAKARWKPMKCACALKTAQRSIPESAASRTRRCCARRRTSRARTSTPIRTTSSMPMRAMCASTQHPPARSAFICRIWAACATR